MRASVEQCPAQLQFVEQIKTNQVTSEYVRELEGVDTTSESAVSTFVGRQGVQFDQEVRGPFLSTTLKEMHERIEDEAMATLCAIDRIVLPVDVLDFPTRITEFKKKAAKELRKQTKLAAADALLRKAQELAAAAEVDTDSDNDQKLLRPAQPVLSRTQLPLGSSSCPLPLESVEAAAAFAADAEKVAVAIGMTSEEVRRLKSEHAAWRGYLLDAQQQLLGAGSGFLIKTVLDLLQCRVFRVNLRSNREVFAMHTLLLDITATNMEVSVEPERGFSFMNGTKTVSRNNLIAKQLNNLMLVGLHAPSVEKATQCPIARIKLEAFHSLYGKVGFTESSQMQVCIL